MKQLSCMVTAYLDFAESMTLRHKNDMALTGDSYKYLERLLRV